MWSGRSETARLTVQRGVAENAEPARRNMATDFAYAAVSAVPAIAEPQDLKRRS